MNCITRPERILYFIETIGMRNTVFWQSIKMGCVKEYSVLLFSSIISIIFLLFVNVLEFLTQYFYILKLMRKLSQIYVFVSFYIAFILSR